MSCEKQFIISSSTPTLVLNNDLEWGIRHWPLFTDLFPEAGQHTIDPLTAGGSVGAVTWTLDSGSLPPGMTLSSSGIYAGTPTEQFDYPDCVSFPNLRRKEYLFTIKATDSIGNFGTQAVTWPVVLAERFQMTYTLPAGATLFYPVGGHANLSPYSDVGWFIDQGFDPAFLGSMNFPVRTDAGVYMGSVGTGARPPESIFPIAASGMGVGTFLYPDLTWRNVVSLIVTYGASWTGILIYDGVKGSLYRNEVLVLTRWSKSSGTDVNPPDMTGQINLTVS